MEDVEKLTEIVAHAIDHAEAAAMVPDGQRMSLVLYPEPGRLLSARMVGQAMIYFCDLLEAAQQEAAGKPLVVNNLLAAGYQPDGGFLIKVAMLPVVEPEHHPLPATGDKRDE